MQKAKKLTVFGPLGIFKANGGVIMKKYEKPEVKTVLYETNEILYASSDPNEDDFFKIKL